MGKITTHVLDTAQGIPGRGISINLYYKDLAGQQLITSRITNDDGRCDAPLLEGDQLLVGEYILEFDVASYYKKSALKLSEPHFLNQVLIQFCVGDAQAHYHVPLLVTPWSYSTYRGS